MVRHRKRNMNLHSGRRRAEGLLRAILEGTAAETGEAFARALVKNLALALDVRYAFVAEFSGTPPARARVLAFWSGGSFAGGFEYDLAGAPCGVVGAKTECLVRERVREAFPRFAMLDSLGVESYFGVLLKASDGTPTGVLGVMDAERLADEAIARTVMRIFAARAGAEIERMRIAAQLAENEKRFRDLVELSADWYWEQDADFRFVEPKDPAAGSTDRRADRFVGKTRWEAFPGALTPEQWAAHRRQLDAHEEFRDFEYAHAADGRELRWVSVSGRPVFDADRRFRGYRGVARDITLRKAAELALRASEERFSGIFRKAPEFMTLVRAQDGTYLDVNEAFERATGYRAREALGRTSSDLGLWAQPQQREEMFRTLARDGRLNGFEYVLRRRDGELRECMLDAVSLEIAGNRCYLFIARDITQRRRAEDALRESEQRFRALVELSSDWYWQTDEAHRFVFRQGEILERMGIPPAADYGKTRWELGFLNMTEADWTAHRARLDRREEFRDLLLERRSPDGRIHWATISGRPLYDSRGRFRGYHGTGRDVTRQVLADRAQREAAAQLNLVADNVPAMIVYYDRDARLRYANRQHAEFYGYALAGKLGRHAREIIGEEAWGEVRAHFDRAFAGEALSYERALERPGQGVAHIHVQIVPDRAQNGRVGGFYAMITDITERKRAEQALRLRDRALESSVNSVMITRLCAEGQKIVYVNPAFERITGYAASEVIGRHPGFLHGEDRDQPGVAALRAATREERDATALVRNYRKDGTPFWNEIRVAPVRDDAGCVTHFIGVSSDVSERVQAQERLQAFAAELERQVAHRTGELTAAVRELESFSYTVSHDLRAPLRGIAGFARILREDCARELSDEGERLLGRIEANAKHMAALIDGLLDHARYSRRPLERARVEPAALVRRTLEDMRGELEHHRVETVVGDLPACFADPFLLERVYANLLSNAVKYSAVRERPRLEVGARTEGEETVYYVRDNGVGFDMRYAGKLFGVFERLHSPEEFPGIGIGLSSVRRIVERHGGRVWAQSAPGEGATFFFTLGAAPPPR